MRRWLPVVAAVAAAAVIGAPAYTLDKATGPFTNPPIGGPDADAPLRGSAVAASPYVPKLWAAAVRYWGGVPQSCAGGVTIALASDDPSAPHYRKYTGWVWDKDKCTMVLNDHYYHWPIRVNTVYEWCHVVAHEMGHMLGLEHSKNRRNIMYGPWIPYVDPDCKPFKRRR